MQTAIEPLALAAYTLCSALGTGCDAHWQALREERGGLRRNDLIDVGLTTWIGRVDGVEDRPLPQTLSAFDCRANRLVFQALQNDRFEDAVQAAKMQYGAHRIGVFIGTTASGMTETERAYALSDAQTEALSLSLSLSLPAGFRYRTTHNGFAVSDFVRTHLGLEGVAQSVLTACSSSAKVFCAAHRHMAAGFCDAAVVGGVDALCLTTLYGFNALQLVSQQPCKPWDAGRDGLSLGEAAGFALLMRRRAAPGAPIALLGYGESSDAHHMSAPHPQGAGAMMAMQAALHSAQLEAHAVDYINLHGTGTPLNDASEDRAVTSLFAQRVPCSSTKGWTGHTLGAAGIVEAILSALCIEHNWLPANLNLEARDTGLRAAIVARGRSAELKHVMSNAFGFGGNNCSLILGRLPS